MKDSSPSLRPVVIAAPAQAFFHLVLIPGEESHRLSFSVKEESTVRYYQIEGSHDMMSFERISRIYAKGGSGLPRTYSASIHDTSYTYYRVRQVEEKASDVLNNDKTQSENNLHIS